MVLSEHMSDATVLLTAVERGEPKAADELLALVYQELRQLATRKMAQEPPGQTLQPTALVHEAWLRLIGSENPSFENRGHFFSAAAEAMRRILIDRARRRRTRRPVEDLSVWISMSVISSHPKPMTNLSAGGELSRPV